MENLEKTAGFDFKSLEQALQDPASKNLIINLLNANNKNVFEFFNTISPAKKKLTKKTRCESPTALLRRRELHKLTETRPESPQSGSSVKSGKSSRSSTVPFENILKDVVAYVEINSNGNDRSAGAKALLKSMGATVREELSKDVTHVIFKDGSYNTYNRAKLLKVHFVSVLWLEASRRNNVRELEKDYPALGTKSYDQNVSFICSQMQKDYADVIRSEIRKTLESGSSLPSMQSLIERGRSQLEDSIDLELGNVSPISFHSEVSSKILTTPKINKCTRDDSSVPVQASIMDLTCLSDSDSDECRSLISRRRISRKDSPNIEVTNKEKTPLKVINNSNNNELYKQSSVEKNVIFVKPSTSLLDNERKNTTRNSKSSSNMSSLRLSEENKTRNSLSNTSKNSKSSSMMSSLRLSSEAEDNRNKNSMENSKSTEMSSLRLSSEVEKQNRADSSNESFRTAEDASEINDENDELIEPLIKSVSRRKTMLANLENRDVALVKSKTRKSLGIPRNYGGDKKIESPFNKKPIRRKVLESLVENGQIDSDKNEGITLRRKSVRLTSRENTQLNDSTTKDVSIQENTPKVPSTSKTTEKEPTRKSRRQTISQKNAKIKENNENIRPKICRSKSESQIDTKSINSRKRKLFDPNDLMEFNQVIDIQDDDKERQIIREEKEKRKIEKTPGIVQVGNLFLTRKAAECLKKNEDNNMYDELFTTPKKKTLSQKNSDKQSQLINEYVNKKQTQIKKNTQTPTPVITTRQKALTDFCKKRRSTLDFQNSNNLPKFRTKLQLNEKPTIVCTKFHKADVQVLGQIVKKLGHFEIENEVSSRTTHLVVGEPLRTINMLRALARGLWIVKKEWLFISLENNKWVPEEKYEVVEFSPAVQRCRLERMILGPKYTMNIFQGLGKIYVTPSTIPRCSDLRELIVLCEGKVTKNENLATIAVGIIIEGCQCVNEYWILDSIRCGKKKSLDKYQIVNKRKSIQV